MFEYRNYHAARISNIHPFVFFPSRRNTYFKRVESQFYTNIYAGTACTAGGYGYFLVGCPQVGGIDLQVEHPGGASPRDTRARSCTKLTGRGTAGVYIRSGPGGS